MHALLFALSALFATSLAAPPATAAAAPAAEVVTATVGESGTLVVNMYGFRNKNGKAMVSLYNSKDGFPLKPGRAYKRAETKIISNLARHVFEGLPAGEYAVSVAHDENGNGEVDTNWIGIPKEGVGASNNAKGRMGPPKFKNAKFSVPAGGEAKQNIKIRYL